MTTDTTGGQGLINATLRDAVRNSAKLIRDCCAAVVTAVSDHPGRSASNSQGYALGEALEVMLKRRSLIEDSFPALLSEGILEPTTKRESTASTPIKFQTLELLDDDAVQEKVESARALQVLNMQLDSVLPQLDALLSGLLGHGSVMSSMNPLRPEVFLRALQRSFAKASASMDAQKIWYAHAVPVLARELKSLYGRVIDDLKAQGVKPVDYFIRRTPASATANSATNPWKPEQALAAFRGSAGMSGGGSFAAPMGHSAAGTPNFNPDATGVFRVPKGHASSGGGGDQFGSLDASGGASGYAGTAGLGARGGPDSGRSGSGGSAGGSSGSAVYAQSSGAMAHADQGAAMLTVDRLRQMLNLGSPQPVASSMYAGSGGMGAGGGAGGGGGDGGYLSGGATRQTSPSVQSANMAEINLDDLFASFADSEPGLGGSVVAGGSARSGGGFPGVVGTSPRGGTAPAGATGSMGGAGSMGSVGSAGLQAAMSWQAAGQGPQEPDAEAEAAMVEQIAAGALRVMIDAIAQDDRLLDPVRKVVLRLEPSLAQLVKADLEFFSDEFHPARVLLDELCQRGLGHTDADSAQFLQFMLPVAGMLRHIESHADMVAAVFAHALTTAQAAWQTQDQERERQAQAAVAALLRAERRDEYTTKVAAQILSMPDLVGVPDPVVDFLTGPWSRVIAQVEFESVLTSPDSQRYRAVIADLSWSTKLEHAGKNRNRLVRMVPPMVAALRAGLATIEYSDAEQQSFFGHLMQWHEQALHPAGANRASSAAIAEPVVKRAAQPVVQDTAWVAQAEVKHSGFMSDFEATSPISSQGTGEASGLQRAEHLAQPDEAATAASAFETAQARAESLTVGTWVEVMIQQRWMRVQLSWMSPQGKLFMFTGADGSSHSMSKRSLNHLFNAGNIRLLAQRKITERALDAVADRALANTLAEK